MKENLHTKGISLIEMLVYVSIVSVIFIFLVNMILSFTSSYKTIAAERSIDNAAMNTMERLTRDIRSATSIDLTHSTFGSSPSTLTLVQTSTTTKFYVQSGVMKVDVNGTYSGPLTITNSSVTSFILTHLTSSNSDAVKIDLTISGTSGTVTRTKNFHSTIVLRGS